MILKKISMKKIALLFSSYFFMASGFADPVVQKNTTQAAQAITESNINVVSRFNLMGLWGMEIPENKSCVEYYNFYSPTDVVIKSANEWSIGQYQYQVPGNRSEQLPLVIMQIKFDNNEIDCSGVKEDQTGEIQKFFVKWSSPEQIQFCANNNGENCFATLNRLIP